MNNKTDKPSAETIDSRLDKAFNQPFNYNHIDLTHDWGFKYIFGQEANKHLLIDFLNAVLVGIEPPIVDVQFRPPDVVGQGKSIVA